MLCTFKVQPKAMLTYKQFPLYPMELSCKPIHAATYVGSPPPPFKSLAFLSLPNTEIAPLPFPPILPFCQASSHSLQLSCNRPCQCQLYSSLCAFLLKTCPWHYTAALWITHTTCPKPWMCYLCMQYYFVWNKNLLLICQSGWLKKITVANCDILDSDTSNLEICCFWKKILT